jgi:hypothetical protein
VDPPSYTQRRLSRDQQAAGQHAEQPKDWSSNNPQGSKVAAAAGSLVSCRSTCRAHL